MLHTKIMIIFPLVLSMSSFAAETASINKSNLYGDWNCQYEGQDSKTKMKVKIDYNVNFERTGKSKGYASLLFNVANLPELEYSLNDNSAWEVKGSNLIITSTDITSVNVSHPELDKFFNLKQLIPTTIDESSTIVTLTKNNLKVKSDTTGHIYSCNRGASKR